MSKLSRVVATATTALALAVPAAAVSTVSASAAPSAPAASADVSERAAQAKLRLSKAKEGTHWGLAGNTITAKAPGKGKVSFYLGGELVDKKKLKKGKASYSLPADLTPGTYKVKAKFKKLKASIKTVVWDSALNVNSATWTISAATPSYQLPYPSLTGTVRYKGVTADKGYVDIYLNGNVEGGSSSPDYCCMAAVATDGTFSFSSSFLTDAQERGQGTWTYRAFYTDDYAFDDSIYSQPITVTVTP